jgi:UMF1 family MFS transporter
MADTTTPASSTAPRGALRSALAPGVRRRELFAWAMFDFANSSYTTVVITAVYNAYFVAQVAGNASWATLAWTSALAVSYALIVLTAPALGAYADLRACKKRLLLLSTIGCVLGTAALALTGPGTLLLAMLLIVFSNYCYSTGENLAAAFLPEIARSEALGRVSGWGWGIGYIGGLFALGCAIAWISHAESLGVGGQASAPATMLITAAIFGLAALPTFLLLRERAEPIALPPGHSLLRDSIMRLGATLGHARQFRDLAALLCSIVFYQAGIQTVIALAAVYAQQALGFGMRETVGMILAVNVTAAIGAFAFGYVQDRLGHRPTLVVTLLLWLATIAVVYAAEGPELFWVGANLAGLALGAAQSAGRALVGYLSPEHRRAEFFGLWGLAVKLASIIGPMTYGLVTWISGGDHRLAMLATAGFFVIGLALVALIDVARGRQAALATA